MADTIPRIESWKKKKIWSHCDLNDVNFLNEEGKFGKTNTLDKRMGKEAATKPDILHFFSKGYVIFTRDKSGDVEKGCQWQP